MKTEKASAEILTSLIARLEAAASLLPQVTGKKMFGCHALWAKDNVFALVWKSGLIGVKLTDEKAFVELSSQKGVQPWKAGPMTMSHWLLLPEGLSAKSATLVKWTKLAHSQALQAKPKAKPKASKR